VWILVAEDETGLRQALQQGLEEENHRVAAAADGPEAWAAARQFNFDALVLDIMLPGLDGLELLRRLRAAGQTTPVLLLTARDAAADVVRGLDAGADDYLTKPFAFQVLLARLRALGRRAVQAPHPELVHADLRLDPAARRVWRGGAPVSLTATEFRLLEFLLRRSGRAVSRAALFEGVWGVNQVVETNTLDAFIKQLREKIDAGRPRRLIHTVRGFGYVLRQDP
jgi:DNA-binding response OmpR family regulator